MKQIYSVKDLYTDITESWDLDSEYGEWIYDIIEKYGKTVNKKQAKEIIKAGIEKWKNDFQFSDFEWILRSWASPAVYDTIKSRLSDEELTEAKKEDWKTRFHYIADDNGVETITPIYDNGYLNETGEKKRPALVLDNDVMLPVAKITLKMKHKGRPNHCEIVNWKEAGLKEPSLIDFSSQMLIGRTQLKAAEYWGHLQDEDLESIKRLRLHESLWESEEKPFADGKYYITTLEDSAKKLNIVKLGVFKGDMDSWDLQNKLEDTCEKNNYHQLQIANYVIEISGKVLSQELGNSDNNEKILKTIEKLFRKKDPRITVKELDRINSSGEKFGGKEITPEVLDQRVEKIKQANEAIYQVEDGDLNLWLSMGCPDGSSDDFIKDYISDPDTYWEWITLANKILGRRKAKGKYDGPLFS